MRAAQFWSFVPYAVVIGVCGLCIVLAILSASLDAWTRPLRSIFPPLPPDNVVDIETRRRRQLDAAARERIVGDAFDRARHHPTFVDSHSARIH